MDLDPLRVFSAWSLPLFAGWVGQELEMEDLHGNRREIASFFFDPEIDHPGKTGVI